MIPVEAAPVLDPDVIIVPMVGFDRHGTRIGYGKGHYDRAVMALRAQGRDPALMGVAFSVQEVDTIPHEPHDIRLDAIVTENETLEFRMRGTGAR
jgi:5-formyltetrahydrofolate cyclo-ligase